MMICIGAHEARSTCLVRFFNEFRKTYMIELHNDLPSYVAAFTASGAVTKADYENVLIPRIEEVYKQHGHIHFLFELKTDVGNFTVNAWWKDLLIGLKHFSNWKRMAIVSDQKFVNEISSALSFVLPGKTKGFSLENIADARIWVAGEIS
jgi:SpoIIAA-like